MSKGIPAMPVYPWWLRINFARHDAVFPSLGGLQQKRHMHMEVSMARGPIPMFQSFSTTVKVDGQPVALQGHDAGPLAMHFSVPSDNAMLPVILAGSSCKWPVSASRRKANGKNMCAFQQIIVPYLICCDRNKDKKDAKPITPPVGGPTGGKKPKPTKQQSPLGANMPGAGLLMIPTGPQTTTLPLGFWDCAFGVARLLVDAGFSRAWSHYGAKPGGGSGLQANAAKRLSEKEVEQKIVKTLWQGAVKNYAKGFLSSAEVKAPNKLAKLDLKTGEITVWTKTVGNVGWKLSDSVPVDFRGWDPLFADAPSADVPVIDDLIDGVFHAD